MHGQPRPGVRTTSTSLWRPLGLFGAAALFGLLAVVAGAQQAPPVQPDRPVRRIPLAGPEGLPEPIAPPRPVQGPQRPGEDRLLVVNGPTLDLVDFREIRLSEAARLLSDRTTLNIVPTADASEVVISVYLHDVQPMVAVDALTRAHGLFWRRDPETEIIRIYTIEEYDADLAAFREEETEVFTLLYPNPLDIAMAIQSLYGNRVVMNLGGLTDMLVMQDLMQRFVRFNMVNAQNLMGGTAAGGMGMGGMGMGGMGMGGMGMGMGGMGMGGMGMGGMGMPGMGMGGMGMRGTGMGMPGMGMGMPGMGMQPFGVTQPLPPLAGLTPEEIQRLEEARTELDALAAREVIDELLRRHRAHIFLTVIPRQNQLIVRTADQRTMSRIRELIHQLDVPTPLVLLEVKVLALDLEDGFSSIFDYQYSDGQLTAGQFTTGNILPPAAEVPLPGNGAPAPEGRAASLSPTGTGLNPNDLIFQVVNDRFRFRMQMLENKNRVTELATPMLLTANNEVSRIFIGQQVPVVVGFNPPTILPGPAGGVGATIGSVPVTEVQDLGQSLIVTPSINADRTVTLRLGQQNSFLIPGGAEILVPGPDGSVGREFIDTVQRTSVTGTVVAKDGLTVAIGGLIEETVVDGRAQVPIVGNLPGIGFFFRRQQTGRSRRELVVLIRPYVFNTPQESAALSSELVPELSLHPRAVAPVGTLESFGPQEVVRPDPPRSPLQTIFRFHSVDPKVY